ncbi:MAG: hypothetical protein JWL86_2785 [Rhizobium sp.]|nr:hypothetical protein [Rhizobium sp.]
MIADGLEDRASECARCVHALAIGSPLIFSNPEALTKWFEAILRHEHEVALGDAVRIKLGSIVEMRSDAPYADQWRGGTMKVVSLAMEPDGRLWASVIEGNPRHRGNGRYDGETTDIDIDHLTLALTRQDGGGGS